MERKRRKMFLNLKLVEEAAELIQSFMFYVNKDEVRDAKEMYLFEELADVMNTLDLVLETNGWHGIVDEMRAAKAQRIIDRMNGVKDNNYSIYSESVRDFMLKKLEIPKSNKENDDK
jgi:hypothetical protein